MSCIKDNGCWDSADYVEEITGYRPCENITLKEWESMENPNCEGNESEFFSAKYWNYPLTEIDHIIENDEDVVLVRFPDGYGGYDYRFCEIPKED